MAYQANKPQPTDIKSQSQADLLGNFQAINTLVNVNHVSFDDPNQGKHKFVSLPVQVAAPSTLANEMALYTKAVTGVSHLFLRNQSNGTEIDMSAATLSATNGTTTLPSGIILKWGRATTNGSGLATVTFTTPFSAILSVQATASTLTAQGHDQDQSVARVESYSGTNMVVKSLRISASGGTPISTTVTWFAIGN